MTFSITRVLKVAEMLEQTEPQGAAPVIVGWGSKGTYQQKKRMFGQGGKRGFDFLVDGDPTQHGKIIDGLEVFPPEHLKTMDADNTSVVVFSIFVAEIEAEIISLGLSYYSTPISQSNIDVLRKFLPHTRENIASPSTGVIAAPSALEEKASDHSDIGIVIQGLFEDDLTIPLVRRYRELYPLVRIFLSTWDTTPEASLAYVRDFVDEIILSPDVEIPGHHNRNRQSFSTHQGLKAAKAQGCRMALKVRTDILIGEDGFLTYLQDMWEQYPAISSGGVEDGVEGRILVPESFSRLAMPLHPSDMVMFGHVDDLIKFWDTGHDSTSEALDFSKSMWDYCIGGSVPEVEFTMKYCVRLTGGLPKDYKQALEWLCDHFLFVDDEALKVFWPKMALNVTYPVPARLYSHAIWKAIALEGKANTVASRIDPKALSWQDFIDSHHKWMPTRCPIDKALSIPQRTAETNVSGYVGLRGLLEIAQDHLGLRKISPYRRNMIKRKSQG